MGLHYAGPHAILDLSAPALPIEMETEMETSFTVTCGYCNGTHTASLDTAPYGGTTAYGHLIYGVRCPEGTRYGVTAHSERRV